MGTLFVAGRLALMMIDYRDFGLGGWDQLVKQTTEKYGSPIGDERNAGWNDGATALSFKHEMDGNTMITLEDLAVMSKYSDGGESCSPKVLRNKNPLFAKIFTAVRSIFSSLLLRCATCSKSKTCVRYC